MPAISTLTFGLFGDRSADDTKVDLQPEFEKKIRENAAKIITNPNYKCPPEVRKNYIAKHHLQPNKLEKIITKICKPTSKIVASFTVEWIVSPAISALFLSKVITSFPSLAILGTTYWTAVSVSLISLAVYPILIISFSAGARGLIFVCQFVAGKVHAFVMSWKNPQTLQPPVNRSANFNNLASVVTYDNTTKKFFVSSNSGMKQNGQTNDREEIQPFVAKSLLQKAYKLEKYNILLEGNKDAIAETFKSYRDDPAKSLPAVNVDIKDERNKTKATIGLDELCANSDTQYNQKYVLSYLVKDCAKKAAEARMKEMQGIT